MPEGEELTPGTMPLYPTCANGNFLGLPDESSQRETSSVIVLPVPYDRTTSYKSGTKDGPAAILSASTQVELYDRFYQSEPALEYGIHTLPPLSPNLSSPDATIQLIAEAVSELANEAQLLVVIGGEHSISSGVSRGLNSVYGDFVTVQLDAHADLRDTYEGTRFSHACAARRISEISSIFQIGIRSLDVTEADYINHNAGTVTTIFAEDALEDDSYLRSLAAFVSKKNVFLTIDVDVFDPSIIPATGTPEPDGLNWRDVVKIIKTVCDNGHVVALDCVELMPIPGTHVSEFTVAKLLYRAINMIQKSRGAF